MNGNNVESIMNKLVHHIYTNHMDLYHSYKEAYKCGSEIIPYIREYLLKGDWQDIHVKGKIQYLTCLMMLLHDIDEQESIRLREEIINTKKCNEIVVTRLNTICSFRISNFEEFHCLDNRFFILKSLGNIEKIKTDLTQWLQKIESHSLGKIDRFYILNKPAVNYLGLFQKVLNVITVFWETPLQSVEYCFYHEIGHYLDPDIEDDDEDREFIADKFARKIFKKNHPIICSPILRNFILPIIFRKIKFDHWKKMLIKS